MRLLLIDDKPKDRLDKIRSAAAMVDPQIEVMNPISNNSPSNIGKAIEKCDLIILDWYFPEGGPQGEDTLKTIRSLNYRGPVLIYTVGFKRFDEFIGPNKADGYYWEAWGIESLTWTIKRLLSRAQLGEMDRTLRISVADARLSLPELPYYGDYQAMKKHFFHCMSTKFDISPATKEKALKKVVLATTEWEEKFSQERKGVFPGNMGRVIDNIERLSDTDIPVLILGDTGTGKELVAKLLHYHHTNEKKKYDFEEGEQKDWFMALNCGAFSEGTLNVELFGSLPGAFTDAVEKAGIFEQVTKYGEDGRPISGGTVFLDEVGLMKESSQAFLLRVLQENYVYRMGHDESKSNKKIIAVEGQKIPGRLFGKIPVKFRLVAATNENLLERTKSGQFRLDLFYRINQVVIKLPPLCNRPLEDFSLLFQYFLHHYNKKYGRKVVLSQENQMLKSPSLDLIQYLWATFPWKGNVRELEGLVASMVALSDRNRSDLEPISLKDIPEFHWEK